MNADRVKRIEMCLERLMDDTGANLAMLLNQSGEIVASCGNTEREDMKSLAALLAGEFTSAGDVAKLLRENDFRVLFQQGIKENIFTELISIRWLLAVIFDRRTYTGLIKVLAKRATDELTEILDEGGWLDGGSRVGGGGPFGGGSGPLGRFDDWAIVSQDEKEQQ